MKRQQMHLDCLTAALIKRNSTLDFPDEAWDVVECKRCKPFVDEAMNAGMELIGKVEEWIGEQSRFYREQERMERQL